MIMRTLFIFALLLISGLIGVQLQHDGGYVLIAMNHWTIESTLWVAMTGLIVLFFILHALLLLLNWLIRFPSTWHAWLKKHRTHTAKVKTRQGFIEFTEGHWQEAKHHLIKALPDAETPLFNYLVAARAAQEMGDSRLRDEYLRQAQQTMPEAKIAVELTQAQLQLANNQWEQALATLKHLQDLAPHHPYVLKLLAHLYEDMSDWTNLLALIPSLKRHHVLPEVTLVNLETKAHLQTLRHLIKHHQTAALTKTFDALPKAIATNPEVIAEYAHYLIKTKQYDLAEACLRQTLRKHFDERLIELYGQIKDPKAQLSLAESLLKTHPNSAALYLCLSRISQTNKLWGKAKTYIEESLKRHKTPAAFAELGGILEQIGDHEEAKEAYKQGVLLALGD
jgi:HemY protein